MPWSTADIKTRAGINICLFQDLVGDDWIDREKMVSATSLNSS
jgi:hypothetical protein